MAYETYIRHADGDTVVLFVHGFLGSPDHFEKFIQLIPENIGIYNVLLCGHGGSVRDFSKVSMEQWKSQVDGIVRELKDKYKNIIIVAHSMGTLFAMDAAVKYPDAVECLFLLGSPLKIGVKGTAFINTLKSLFGRISEDDDVGKAYDKAHSIKLTLKLWEYIGWIPRYLELFGESKRGRSTILDVNVPCYIFQSVQDELVSIKSVKHIPKKENIKLTLLEHSAHFIYNREEFKILTNEFSELLRCKL